jgi:response regulator of citrate/malate metabolism
MTVDVLLLEDNYSDVLLIKNVVQEFSLDVRITNAKDTESAIALLFDPGFKPQLVLADMHLTTGVEGLVKRSEARHVPVVVFSSELSPGEVAEVLKLGVREYVVKPTAWDEFRDVVVGIFSKWTPHVNPGTR